jgi:Bacterial Ig-like domain (group 3)
MRGWVDGRRTVLTVLTIVAVCAVFVSRAGAASYDWAGHSEYTAAWSDGGNWEESSSPSSPASLVFPHVGDPTCASSSPTEACYVSENDLSGLAVESIQLDDGNFYEIGGDSISLGAGGLTAVPDPASSGAAGAYFALPVQLSAGQEWSVTNREGGGLGETGLVLAGNVTGAYPLTIGLSDGPALFLNSTMDVASLTFAGKSTTGPPVVNGLIALTGGRLNSYSGQPVNLEHVFLVGQGAVGQLRSTSSTVAVDIEKAAPPEEWSGTLTAASATFDSSSTLAFEVAGSGTVGGSDYSRLVASGNVQLGDASLLVGAGPRTSKASCPSLAIGAQYTLISTTGTLSGEFANAPEGGEIPIEFAKECAQVSEYLKIGYDRTSPTRTVTATVMPGPTSTTSLSISPAGIVTNQAVTLNAKVIDSIGTPEGSVEFLDDGTPSAQCPTQRVSGLGYGSVEAEASCGMSFAAAGSPQRLEARFTPGSDINLRPSSSGPRELVVGKDATATTMLLSTSSIVAGAPVTYTASVSPQHAGEINPTGAVAFLDNGTPIATCSDQASSSGQATCQITYAQNGTHTITASYLGDENFSGSSSTVQTLSVFGAEPFVVSSVVLLTSDVTVKQDRSAGFKLACRDGTTQCNGELTLYATRTVKAKHVIRKPRTITLGDANFSIDVGQTRTITIKLNARARTLLKAVHGSLTAQLHIDVEGATTVQRTVNLVIKAPGETRRSH